MSKKDISWLRPAAIGPHLVICTAIGYGIGFKLDQWTGWKPVMTVIFTILGVVAGFRYLFRELALINEADMDSPPTGTEPPGDVLETEEGPSGKGREKDAAHDDGEP